MGELIDTIEYDYLTFHLSMNCYWAKVVASNLELKEVSDSKWLTREQLDSIEWLPADVTLIEKKSANYIMIALYAFIVFSFLITIGHADIFLDRYASTPSII